MRARTIAMMVLLGGCKFSRSLGADGGDDGSGGSGSGSDGGGSGSGSGNPEAGHTAACFTNAAYDLTFGGHAYRALTTPDTYDVQTAACTADGAHLVTIDTAAEDVFVHTHVMQGWIGFDDLTVENRRHPELTTTTTFAWQVPSTSSYTNWNGGEPNDSQSSEDCAYTDTDNFQNRWNDDNCEHTKPALCECEDAVTVPAPPTCMAAVGITTVGRKYIPIQGVGNTTWDLANAACGAIGAYLFTPADDTEDNLVGKNRPIDIEQDFWIGYADTTAAIGVFQWTNGAPHDYERWLGTGPTTVTTRTCITEHEVGNSGDATAGAWKNVPCTETHPYVCECDPWAP